MNTVDIRIRETKEFFSCLWVRKNHFCPLHKSKYWNTRLFQYQRALFISTILCPIPVDAINIFVIPQKVRGSYKKQMNGIDVKINLIFFRSIVDSFRYLTLEKIPCSNVLSHMCSQSWTVTWISNAMFTVIDSNYNLEQITHNERGLDLMKFIISNYFSPILL